MGSDKSAVGNKKLTMDKVLQGAALILIALYIILGVMWSVDSKEAHFITARQIADRAKVSISTVYDWNKQGFLPKPEKIGVQLLWKEADITDWIATAPRRIAPER